VPESGRQIEAWLTSADLLSKSDTICCPNGRQEVGVMRWVSFPQPRVYLHLDKFCEGCPANSRFDTEEDAGSEGRIGSHAGRGHYGKLARRPLRPG
jgi:hypothetical protein